MHLSRTFLSGFANYFNVLHGNFEKLLCDEGCHVHLRSRKKKKKVMMEKITDD